MPLVPSFALPAALFNELLPLTFLPSPVFITVWASVSALYLLIPSTVSITGASVTYAAPVRVTHWYCFLYLQPYFQPLTLPLFLSTSSYTPAPTAICYSRCFSSVPSPACNTYF